MSEAKHTELPWALDPDDRPGMEWNNHIISLEKPNLTICFMTHDGTKDNEEGQANAEFIVRACNSHYALVEALENMVKMWEFLNPQYDLVFEKKTGVTLSKACAALKQAKGES